MTKNIFFVVLPEDGVWVAHGLQKNIVTHGESLSEVRDNIYALMEAYRTRGGLESVPPAHEGYWKKFVEAYEAGRDLDKYLDTPAEDNTYKLELQTA